MKTTSVRRLIALTVSTVALSPSNTVYADAISFKTPQAKSNVLYIKDHASLSNRSSSRKEMYEKRRLLREDQADAEALHVRNMLMLMAVLRSQQSGAKLSVASVSN